MDNWQPQRLFFTFFETNGLPEFCLTSSYKRDGVTSGTAAECYQNKPSAPAQSHKYS